MSENNLEGPAPPPPIPPDPVPPQLGLGLNIKTEVMADAVQPAPGLATAPDVKVEAMEPMDTDESSVDPPSSVQQSQSQPDEIDDEDDTLVSDADTEVTEGDEDFESAGFVVASLLDQVEAYKPTVPDSITNYLLHMAGLESSDPRVPKLISIASQKFISDILNDAFTHCKLRTAAPIGGKTKSKDKKYVLTMEDLVPVLSDYGITVKKPPYFV